MATIDGSSQLGILWRIILPLSKPIVVTVGLFEFNRVWSDYLAPLIFLQRREQFTLAIGLTYFLDFAIDPCGTWPWPARRWPCCRS